MPKAAYSNGLAIWDRIQREEEEDEEECAVCMFVCRWYIFGAGSTMAADKFAYVDLTRAFSEYTKTKDYDKALGEKQSAYEQEREKLVNEVKALEDKMKLLSDKEKNAKKMSLKTRLTPFASLTAPNRQTCARNRMIK